MSHTYIRVSRGKDLAINWPVLVNNQPADLTGLDLSLVRYEPNGKEVSMQFTVENGVIATVFRGRHQTQFGNYRFRLWANRKQNGETHYDFPELFTLVRWEWEENIPQGSGVNVVTLNLSTGNILIGAAGRDADIEAAERAIENANNMANKASALADEAKTQATAAFEASELAKGQASNANMAATRANEAAAKAENNTADVKSLAGETKNDVRSYASSSGMITLESFTLRPGFSFKFELTGSAPGLEGSLFLFDKDGTPLGSSTIKDWTWKNESSYNRYLELRCIGNGLGFAYNFEYGVMNEISGKVDKENGKGLSTQDFTTALKEKLESLSNYDDTEVRSLIENVRTSLDLLIGGKDTSAVIDTFNEVISFLNNFKNSENLSSVLSALKSEIQIWVEQKQYATKSEVSQLDSKMGELEEEIGIIESVDVVGKNENWSTKTLSRVYKQGEKILIRISGNPSFAGTSEGQTFINLTIRRKGTSTNLKILYNLIGNVAFEPKELVYTATEDCVIYIEGRWHTDENVLIEVKGSVMADISELKKDNELVKSDVSAVKSDVSVISKMERTAQRLFYSSQLNFNNTTKQIEIKAAYISAPTTTSTRIEIPAQNIDYPFNSGITTLPLLVYDLSTLSYKTTTIQQITSNMYVLAAILITGKGTSSRVNKVYYSAVANCRIDDINAEVKADNALVSVNDIDAILGIKDIQLNITPIYRVGTNYNNKIDSSSNCIADSVYYKVKPNSTLKVELAEGWLIRIVQCDANKNNLQGADSYAAISYKSLRADTEYIRYAVQNLNYNASNPITLDAIDSDTCKIYEKESQRLVDIEKSTAKIEEISLLPDVIFGSKINFDDYKITVYDERSGKWAGGGSSSYNGIFIPVRKGYRIKITANPNYGVLYSQVKEYGVYGKPVVYADGFEDRITIAKGTTSVFEILDTCKYLWVANKSSVDNKPSYIGFAPIGGGQSVIEEDIISRNKHKEAQVLCAGYSGDTIKHFGFIHVSDIHTRKEDYKCFESMCKFLQHYDNLKCAIATGDLVYDHFASTIEYYNKGLEQTTKSVYNVIGNHDAGQQSSTTPSLDRVSSDAQCYEKYIAPYIGNWEVKTDGGGVPHPSGKSYYFNDFTDEKVRMIVVCEFETDYELSETDPEHKLKWSREYRAMRQEQINWLIDSLSTTPSGYGVIVALHQLDTTKNEDNEFVSGYLAGERHANIYTNSSQINWFVRILDAFQKHTALNFTFEQTGAVVGTMVVNADFTNKADTEFICTVCGHTHNDYIGHYKDTDLVVLNIGSDNTTYTGKICPRKVGTIAEDLFNVVNIDRNRKKITIIRIGSDSSVEGQDRRRITIKY